MRHIGRDRGGFALIGALWLLVMISVVGLEFALQARGMAARAINASDHAVARAAAEGCVAYAQDVLSARLRATQGLGLGGASVLDPFREPGRLMEDTLELGEARCVAHLTDPGARLHLNRASEQELRRLFIALRLDASDGDEIAQSIMDWRDLDRSRRVRGAEAEEYVRDGRPVLPANGPFGAVSELALVRGVTSPIYQRIAPFLTVWGSGRVSLTSAPTEVLSSLPGMSDEVLALILRARRSGAPVGDILALSTDLDPASQDRLRADLPALMGRVVAETEEVLVIAEAWIPGAAARSRATAVVVRSGGSTILIDQSVR